MNDVFLKYHQGNLTATIHGNTMERLWYDDNNSLKGESEMKNITKTIILAVAVAAFSALLLAGCQNGSPPTQKVQEEHTEAQTDSLKEDSMKVFYERMERWEMLHGGMSRWESDK